MPITVLRGGQSADRSHGEEWNAALIRVYDDAALTWCNPPSSGFDLGATMSSRMRMYKTPLEHYIAIKINQLRPHSVKRVRISRITADAVGCNWKVIETIPALSPQMARTIDREVIDPLRDIIRLIN